MNILVKYPSRGRPERFFKSLDSLVNNLAVPDSCHINCTLDEDDPTMNNTEVIDRLALYKNLSVGWGRSDSKVHAVNRNLPTIEWDILLVHSDDMMITFYGFDEIIRQEFAKHGLDTLLHIPDQDAREHLATMYIAGKKFYERFGFIYDNGGKSLFVDNLVQDCAKHLGKYVFANIPGVIKHLNPSYGHLPKDQMYIDQQLLGWSEDQDWYNNIKRNGIENYLKQFEK